MTAHPETTPRLRVVIVDDEQLARAILRELLAAHPDVDIVAECGNGFEAVKAVTTLKPGLLLLDIQMPKLDGFDVLDLVGPSTPVIFVTAYDAYAVRAFEVHAVDYLLKPFSADRLGEALARARERIRSREPLPVRDLLSDVRRHAVPLQRLLIRDRAEVHVIAAGRIDYIEAQDDYAAVRSAGRTYLKEQTLAELETLLDASVFVRIHRRYIINLARLARIEQTVTDSRSAVLSDGTELPISKSGYARLKALL
jgi:two-component system LytT family response regulator